MDDYTQKTEEYDFVSLVEDDEFKSDLVKFFTGGRYQYSKEEIMERGWEGLAKDFVTHMRYQSWNEVEAVRDLSYVKGSDYNPLGKEAFGRLMQAWDNSDSAGQGFGDSVGDFTGAVLSAPSTYVGLGSFGLGKLGAKAATKATQAAVRYGLKDHLKKNVVKTGINRNVKKEALKEAGIGFTTGAIIGGVQSGAQGETREEVIDGYEYTNKDLLFDAAVSGTIDGALGYASGIIGRKTRVKADDYLKTRKIEISKKSKETTKIAIDTLNNATEEQKKAAMTRVSDLEEVLSARAGLKDAKLKDRLDPERVAKGRAILNSMSNPDADPIFGSGLSADTMRKVAAASIDLMQQGKLNIKDGERITQSVADAIRNDETGEIFGILEDVRSKYGLSKDEFSLIYLSEVSRAGQTLGFASAIKRGANLAGVDELFAKGASSVSSDEMATIAKEAIRRGSKKGGTRSFLQDLDAMRIAFMTSQPVTTMRNLRNSGILIGTDMVDQVNRVLYKGITGDLKQSDVKDFIPNITAILRGYTLNNAEAKVVREILFEEANEQYRRLFNDAMRIDVGLEGNSIMSKAGRFVNSFNTATDSILKEGMFYGDLDRQFREQGLSLKDWLKQNKTLDDLPPGVSVEAAAESANRFTMQRTFREDDSLIAEGTKKLVDLNRRMPFLISEGIGIPFPRYVGNHLQMVAEYTPVIGEILQQTGVAAKTDDASLRVARQMTGTMMLFAGWQVAEMRNGEADYGSLKNTILNSEGMTEDMKPYVGAALAHMYVGDYIWRKQNGLPAEIRLQDVQDIAGGIPDFSFDLAVGSALIDFVKTGDSEDLEKEAGNILSTFTYPLTISRDVYAQLEPDAAGAPYTRDLAITADVNTKGAGGGSGIFLGQTTRMLMDSSSLQYTQSFNGENDIKYYRFSNPVAIGSVNPVLKQISGSTDEPPATGLEEEMSKFQLKDWEVYNRRTVPNANVDLLLRRRLARGNPETGEESLAAEFDAWRKEAPASKRFGRMTYDEIVASDKISSTEKQELLEGWIKKRIREEKDKIELMFNTYVAQKPLQARGFIRNNYVIVQNKQGKEVFDMAARELGFSSANEMISSSENVTEEINRRLRLLSLVPNLAENEPY